MNFGICYSQNQSDFNFEIAVEESKNYTGFNTEINSETNWPSLFRLFEGE